MMEVSISFITSSLLLLSKLNKDGLRVVLSEEDELREVASLAT